jgi:hypothetical protein
MVLTGEKERTQNLRLEPICGMQQDAEEDDEPGGSSDE